MGIRQEGFVVASPVREGKRYRNDGGVGAIRWALALAMALASSPARAAEAKPSSLREQIVAYYSVDDEVCQPLAKAATTIMNEKLSTANFMEHSGNDKVLERAGFTLPKPLSGVKVPANDEVYDLDLANDGRRWQIYFHNTTDYRWTWITNWFVLKPGHVSGFANPQDAERQFNVPKFALPKDDVAAQNFDPRKKDVMEGLLLPLDPTHRVKKWQHRDHAESYDMESVKTILSSGFTLPLLYQRSAVYLLSSIITDGGGDDEFVLARFTPELKVEAYCYLIATDQLSSPTTNPTAP